MKRALALASVVAATTTMAASVNAQSRTDARGEAAADPKDAKRAQEHFQRARELYQGGHYSEAAAELEVARGLDPRAKDLVMNLALVHEKLGHYDEALTYLKSFMDMDGVTSAERIKADGLIKRIEGEKRAAAKKEPAPPMREPTPPSPAPAPPPTVVKPAESPSDRGHGRIDGWTVFAGSLSIAGFLTFGGAGTYALVTRPSGFVTGRDGSYAELEDKTSTAHKAAFVADIGLGVGVVAAVATLWLYFGRTKSADARAASGLLHGTF